MGKVFDLGHALEKEIEPSNQHDDSEPSPAPNDEQESKVVKARASALSFPFQVMTGAAGCFANVYKDYLETPETFLFMSYITCHGVAVSKKLTISSELRIQPRFYTVLVGESARDRKSTSIDITIRHFESVVEKFSSCWGLGSAEGLQKLLKKNDGQDKPGTVLVWDELKALIDKCKIYNSVLLPCINTLFESNKYENYTKKTSVNINHAHVSILGASTLATYQRMYDSAFIDIGFPNRVFLVIGTAKRQFSFPEKVPQQEISQMKQNLNQVLEHVGDGFELGIEDDARKLYHDWYMNIANSIHARRLDGYAIRLMMLLAINNQKRVIDVETVKDAIALCDWQFEIRKMYDPIDADTLHAKMEEGIRRVLKRGPLKDRELKQKTNARRYGLWVYKTALNGLQEANEIIWCSKNKKWYLLD
nr:DUF3987 domain-containing protein [Bacteroidota bacterium]